MHAKNSKVKLRLSHYNGLFMMQPNQSLIECSFLYWLLNYRGGSFAIIYNEIFIKKIKEKYNKIELKKFINWLRS